MLCAVRRAPCAARLLAVGCRLTADSFLPMHAHPRPRRRAPDWLIGLLLAVVVVPLLLWGLRVIGAGDDPSFTPDPSTTVTTDNP
jgi:hypothetical protein